MSIQNESTHQQEQEECSVRDPSSSLSQPTRPFHTPAPSGVSQQKSTGFSEVQIHPNSTKAVALSALAFTQGNHIHFAPGMYKPHTTEGRKLLSHEYSHVVQQREGRVKPTTWIQGLPVNDEKKLEDEADAFKI